MPLAPYFAFGSNMDEAQMARRCPSARIIGEALLEGYELVFRGPSQKRGGGVLSVDLSEGSAVRGILWQVTRDCIEALDAAEGCPWWYVRAPVMAHPVQGDGARRAFVYRLPERVVPMLPTRPYLEQVRRAYARWGYDPEPLERAAFAPLRLSDEQ